MPSQFEAERIAALEEEIKAKTQELRLLRESRRLNYEDYSEYQRDKYGKYSLLNVFNAPLRDLAIRMVMLVESTRPGGSKYLSFKKGTRIKDLTAEQVSFCNSF